MKRNETQTEYEVGDQITFETPEASTSALNGLSRAIDHIKLESRLIAFDLIYRTNYRQIRHELVREQRLAAFESSIGLERTE